MKEKLFKPFKTMFSVMKFVGLWQDGNQSWTYFFYGYLNHFLIVELCLVGELICAYYDETLEDFIETMGLGFTYIAEMFKSINFFFKIKLILKLYAELVELVDFSADDRWKNREQLQPQINFGFKVYKIFWISAWTTCVMSAIVPFTARKLPYKVWFPFDTENSDIGFWVASVYLIVDSFFCSAIDFSLDTLPVFFLVFVIGMINELSDRLDEIGKIKNENQTDAEFMNKELKKCIEIHLKLKKLVGDIQSIFSSVILIQGLCSSMILCMGVFSMSTVSLIATLLI